MVIPIVSDKIGEVCNNVAMVTALILVLAPYVSAQDIRN